MNAAAVSQLVVGPTAIAALAKAAVIAGGSSAIAKLVRADAGVAAQWMCGEAVLPAEHCSAIEALTDVPCEALRPDLHWIRVDGEVLGYLVAEDGVDGALLEQALRNEAIAPGGSVPSDVELIYGKWPASAYLAGLTHSLEPEAAKRLLSASEYAGKAWTRELLDSLASDVADAGDQWSAHSYCMGMLRGLPDADFDRILDEHKPRGWDGWTEEKSDAVWAEAEAIRQRDRTPASRSLTVADVDLLAAAARDVIGDIHNLKDLFARGELVRKDDEKDKRPWPVAAISESGNTLDQACGDVLEKLGRGLAKKPAVMGATKGGEESIAVNGAILSLLIQPDASIEDCFSDGLCYLESGIAAGLEKSDEFDQSMWAAFHLLSLGKGLLMAAQDKLYAFDRQQATE